MRATSVPIRASTALMLAATFTATFIAAAPARAEPYLALAQGLKCSACHVNLTGGGMRNVYGNVFAQTILPAQPIAQGSAPWTGRFGEYFGLGADLRERGSDTVVRGQPAQRQTALDGARLYLDAQLLPGRFGVYVDEVLGPGNARTLEAHLRYTDPELGWHAKAGQFYLPFGWRLQDASAFVRTTTGIGMTTPGHGVELGLERGDWSAQLALTRGVANVGAAPGHQLTGQLAWVRPSGRVGIAASSVRAAAGDRRMIGAFAGVRTGPLVWLGEADLVQDDGFPEGRRTLAAALGEVNWGVRRGHNLKFTVESLDPDRRVREDQKARYGLLYEFTPVPFLQLRAGVRRYLGIPQNDVDNRREAFVEVHGFF